MPRLKIALMAFVYIAILFCASVAIHASEAGTWLAPGKNGGAAYNGTFYEVSLSGTSMFWGRRGDTSLPNWSDSRWVHVPGVASDRAFAVAWAGSRFWVAHRDTNGKPMVFYSDNIHYTDSPSWNGWEEFGESMYSAPGMAVIGGRVYVFWVPWINGPIYYKWLPVNQVTGWSQTYSLGGEAFSAPHAVIVGNELLLLHRGNNNRIMARAMNSSHGWGSYWWQWTSKAFNQPTYKSDWSYSTQWGGHINGRDNCDGWSGGYHYYQINTSQSKTVKFVMDYDSNWKFGPNGRAYEYACDWSEISTAISAGANVICFRTAETRIGANYLKRFMGDLDSYGERMRFKDMPSTYGIRTFIEQHPNILFIIEIGNEPNVAEHYSISAENYALALIDTGRNGIPLYKTQPWSGRVWWCASMPVYDQMENVNYIRTVMSSHNVDGIWRNIQDSDVNYQMLGVHSYGYNDLSRWDGREPWKALFFTMAKLRPGKTVYVSEMGINSQSSWADKGWKSIEFIRRLPGEVFHVSFFCQDRYSRFQTDGFNYVIDSPYNQTPILCDGQPYLPNYYSDMPFANQLRNF